MERNKKNNDLTTVERNHVVKVYSIENDGNEIETGIFGPLTEAEADGWCKMFENLQGKSESYMLVISELNNPWTFYSIPYGYSIVTD